MTSHLILFLDRTVLTDWRMAISNRPFVQFYLGLPLAARHATGDETGVGAIFVLTATLGIVAQVPVTRFCRLQRSAWCSLHLSCLPRSSCSGH